MIATRAQVSRLRSGAGGGMASPGRSLSKIEQLAMNKPIPNKMNKSGQKVHSDSTYLIDKSHYHDTFL
jgi:hypothetical protein